MAGIDRPWHRPGELRYALHRLPGLLRPPVEVFEPAADSLDLLKDLPVAVRDGTVLRVNVVLPAGGGRFPVLLSAQPYGKDKLPTRRGRGWRVSVQYRMMRQTGIVRFSSLTGWEAPDPAWWAGHGYAVANCDLRGSGTSAGEASLLSDQEGADICDVIEWAAAQPWSTGAVGMLGVSYLAISQWKAAALQPAHLKAICPWEGFTDAYRDWAFPGGVAEKGFSRLWRVALRNVRQSDRLSREQLRRELRDDWWQALVPNLKRITVPTLVCGSFSDNNLHGRGSFRGWQQVGSREKYLYTHRDGKWARFYSADARDTQLAFFDRYLRGRDVGQLPRVRLEIRETRDQVDHVRAEDSWPLARTQWTPLYLTTAGLASTPAAADGHISFSLRRQGACFDWAVPADVEVTGPMAVRLWVEVDRANDVNLFAGVEKWRASTYIGFEGSYGFGRDRITTGWLKASLRDLDQQASHPFDPVPACTSSQPLVPGQPEPVDIALGPSATLFRAGETLRLVIAGRWLWSANLLTGQFPASYQKSAKGRCTLHFGPQHQARLLIPVIP